MAAYEVLLLNTAIPQIQAAQSGDTYVVPRDIAINATAIISANSATDALRITQTGTGNALLVEDSANPDSTPFVVTATGDVGIGTSSPSQKLELVGGNVKVSGTNGYVWINSTTGTNQSVFLGTNTGGTFYLGLDNSAGNTYNTGSAYGGVLWSPTNWNFIVNNGTKVATIDASGNLGLGVTNPGVKLDVAGQGRVLYDTGATNTGDQSVVTVGAITSGAYSSTYGAGLQFQIQNSGGGYAGSRIVSRLGADNNTATLVFQARNYGYADSMTLDASGNLLVGRTNSDGYRLALLGTTQKTAGLQLTYQGVQAASISVTSTGALAFGVDGSDGSTERARITSGGYFKASDDGTYLSSAGAYHELRQSAGDWTARIQNTNATAANCYGIKLEYRAAAPNGTGNSFVYCEDNGTTLRAEIRSNGGLANYQSNNVDLSDIRTKTDISPLASYWNKIAALEIVSYKYKDQTHDDLNIGVIAQQVEQVAPEFVDANGFGEPPEDGVPLKTIYNKDLTFAAIKALQEAMARIETLEAEVAALKGA